jgi:hypothetical protein
MLRAIHGQCTPNSIAVCENLKLPGPGDGSLCGCRFYSGRFAPDLCTKTCTGNPAEQRGGVGTLSVYGGRQP